MAHGQRILALDVGASTIKLAEFLSTKAGGVELVNFGVSSIGSDTESDQERAAVITATIKELLHDCKIKPGPVLLSVSGQSVFSRFVKLPPVDKDKVYQIIAYEAQQNVPFPINEVVWDYQLIGRAEGELDVMLAAIKADIIVGLTAAVEQAGLDADLVDVGPVALYNAVRFNYADAGTCTLVVDIGARSTDLIFIDQGRVFIRSVPVAGSAITQQIMREFELSHDDAEELKKAHAFVAFGGAYEEPKSEVADKVSKIVRNVMTRMHAEIDRSIKFYRTQQGGSQPTLLLLTGGSSTIPYLDQFLKEKLKLEVESLNPFINVTVASTIDTADIAKHAHELAQVVGLGLRKAMSCPIEVNLLPPHIVQEKEFRRRQPLLVGAVMVLVVIIGIWAAYFSRMAGWHQDQHQQVQGRVQALETIENRQKRIEAQDAEMASRLSTLEGLMESRARWLRLLEEISVAMPEHIWIAELKPERAAASPESGGTGIARGSVTSLTVRGMGYIDKVQSTEYIHPFRDTLRASDLFSDASEFSYLPAPPPGEYVREFILSLALEKPVSP